MGSRPHKSLADVFKPAPEPVTPLARHRILSSTAGIKVSPLCLGGMNLGTAWESFMGGMPKEETFKLLDYFWEAGGNFIDTSNNYQDQQSESLIGDWMETRHNRDQIVLATKYTTFFNVNEAPKQGSSFTGNNAKSLHTSLAASLRKLRTDYIDVLYVHWWDFSTSVEELMQSLNRVVQRGQVLYLGISDTPAWVVTKANQYARDHGLAPFTVYQGLWSATSRDMENDIVPMCVDEGMAIAPWGALGSGKYKNAEQRQSDEGRRLGAPAESDIKMADTLEAIGKRHGGVPITGVALAYVMHSAPHVYPIVGGRKTEHLKGNIDALKVRLSDEDIAEIQKASGWSTKFPMSFIAPMLQSPGKISASDVFLTTPAVHLDVAPPPQPFLPSGK